MTAACTISTKASRLVKLLAQKTARVAKDAAMEVRVTEEMRVKMDTGVRVNPALAAHYGPVQPEAAAAAAPAAAAPAAEGGAAPGETIDLTNSAGAAAAAVAAEPIDLTSPVNPSAPQSGLPAADSSLGEYRLCACIWHAGSTASSGHYIADVLRPAAAGRAAIWQRFNDSYVSSVAENAQELASKGYIFFYVHTSALGRLGPD